MALDKELIDKLLEGYQKPEDLVGQNGLLKQLTKALVERAMNAELTHHLGYEKNDPDGRRSGNSRNGSSRKKLTGDFGQVDIEVPRDREGEFEPQIVGKHQRRFDGFDDKILSMYARGMSKYHSVVSQYISHQAPLPTSTFAMTAAQKHPARTRDLPQ